MNPFEYNQHAIDVALAFIIACAANPVFEKLSMSKRLRSQVSDPLM